MSYAIPSACKDARNLLIKAKTDPTMDVYEFEDIPCVAVFQVDNAYKARFDISPDTSEPYLLMYGHVKGYRIDASLDEIEAFPNGEQEIVTVGNSETPKAEAISEDLLYSFMDEGPVRSVFKPYTFLKSDRRAARAMTVAYRFNPSVVYEDEEGVTHEINEFANIFKKGWLDTRYGISKLDRAELEVPVKATYIQCVDKETGDSVAVIKGVSYTEMDAMTSHYYLFTDMLDDIREREAEFASEDLSFEFGDDSRYLNDNFEIHEETPTVKKEEEIIDTRSKEEIREDELIEALSAKIQSDYEARVLEAKAEKEKRIKELIESRKAKEEEETASKKDDDLLVDDTADRLFGGDTVDEEEDEALNHEAEVAAAKEAADDDDFDDSFGDEEDDRLDRDKAVKHMEEVSGAADGLDDEDEFF